MTASRTFSWLLTVCALAAGGFLLSAVGLAGPLRSGVLVLVEPLAAGIEHLSSPVVDVIGNAGSYGDLRDENRDLRVENERLRADLARLREERVRAADADELLNLRAMRPNETFTYAAVIGRDPSPTRAVLAINRGSGDGIRAGMPVLGRGGALVGTVERVQEGISWVRLITDPESDVNAVIQESRALALASGQAGGKLSMQFLAEGIDVKPGDTVLTSGIGGLYPKDLYIGRVAGVEGAALDVFKRARVEPAVRLTSLENVAVLTSFQPLKLGGR
jgi:rod shape-determining protein MreC